MSIWLSKKGLESLPICEEAWSIVRPEVLEGDAAVEVRWTAEEALTLARKDAEGPNIGVVYWYEHVMKAPHVLRYEDLSESDLSGINFCGVDLRYADLSGSNLSGANLKGADLRGAKLTGADMTGALIYKAKLPEGWQDIVAKPPREK